MGELFKRRAQTEKRIRDLQEQLKDSEKLTQDKACAYATGSFGRGEASHHSDLDLFILGKPGAEEASCLRALDEIWLKGRSHTRDTETKYSRIFR